MYMREGDIFMSFTFNHFNFNVLDLDRSLAFYKEALGLHVISQVDNPDFSLTYLGDDKTGFRLELTYMKNRTTPYDLGEQEYHLAMTTDDMEKAHEKHKKMGCIEFENPAMGIYFITDPDGYWIEIVRDGSYMESHTK